MGIRDVSCVFMHAPIKALVAVTPVDHEAPAGPGEVEGSLRHEKGWAVRDEGGADARASQVAPAPPAREADEGADD